jgi:arylsulfatase A-like enzyme
MRARPSLTLLLSVILSVVALPALVRGESGSPTSSKPHVLLVAFGGIRGDVLPKVKTPVLDSLRKAGAYSAECLSVLPSRSGPTWTSLLTGQGPASHGVQENDFAGWRPNRAPALPSILRSIGYKGGFIAVTQNEPMGKLLFDADEWLPRPDDDAVEDEALRWIETEDPGVLFAQFDAAEKTSGRFGYEVWSPLYRAAFSEFDRRLGRLCASLRSRPNYAAENWLVIVTANHGSQSRKPGAEKESDRHVFLLISGPRVEAGANLGPTFQVDIVPTLLTHLGVAAPDSLRLTGTPRGILAVTPMDGGVKEAERPAIRAPEGRGSLRYSRGATLRMAR